MNKKQNAFTLIELLVVMALIGVLASIVMVSLKGVIEKARMAKVLKFSQGIQNVLGADIVLNLSFDDQANPTRDASGYGNNGTISGAGFTDDTPHKVLGAGPARGKYALYFDGDDYVNLPNSTSLSNLMTTGSPSFTLEAWIHPFSNSIFRGFVIAKMGYHQGILTADGCGGNNKICFQLVNTTNTFFTTPSFTYSAGIWRHVVGVYEANTKLMSFYVDGNLIGTNTLVGDIKSSGNFYIGGCTLSPSTCHWNGRIDEVRIYNRALTAMKIQKHYAEGAVRHSITLK